MSHNASNSHKQQSVTLSLPPHSHCSCVMENNPGSIYFQVERKGNGNKFISTCLSPNGTSDRFYFPQKGSQQLKTAPEYLPSSYAMGKQHEKFLVLSTSETKGGGDFASV